MTTLALETVGLSKHFGMLRVADDVNFQLPEGARHALIGPNGAGKTSFINLVTGELTPSAGRILLAGQDITAAPIHRRVRAGLGRTFQTNSLFNGLSVIENVALSISERERTAWSMIRLAGRERAILDEAYALTVGFGLADFASCVVSTLSYGHQRLVEIAVALACRPLVLLLDEPAAGVPAGEASIILDALERLPANIAVLLIEHDMDIVYRFARQITVLDRGRILVEGTPDEIAANEDVRRIYFGETEAQWDV
jgi:ABC-type branched-subunit amino acid transport system ATPase component